MDDDISLGLIMRLGLLLIIIAIPLGIYNGMLETTPNRDWLIVILAVVISLLGGWLGVKVFNILDRFVERWVKKKGWLD